MVEQPKNEETGNPEVDAVVREGKRAMQEMGRLYSSIENPDVKKRIVEIMDISDKIVKNATRNVQAAWVGDTGVAPGQYSFDAEGKMVR